jgi:hypothetical protein
LIAELPDDPWEWFRSIFQVPSSWGVWDVGECAVNIETRAGSFEKRFPVAIKSGDEIHAGMLLVKVWE